MHTFKGKEVAIHYNSDLSGNLIIHNPTTKQEMEVPAEDITHMMAQAFWAETNDSEPQTIMKEIRTAVREEVEAAVTRALKRRETASPAQPSPVTVDLYRLRSELANKHVDGVVSFSTIQQHLGLPFAIGRIDSSFDSGTATIYPVGTSPTTAKG